MEEASPSVGENETLSIYLSFCHAMLVFKRRLTLFRGCWVLLSGPGWFGKSKKNVFPAAVRSGESTLEASQQNSFFCFAEEWNVRGKPERGEQQTDNKEQGEKQGINDYLKRKSFSIIEMKYWSCLSGSSALLHDELFIKSSKIALQRPRLPVALSLSVKVDFSTFGSVFFPSFEDGAGGGH